MTTLRGVASLSGNFAPAAAGRSHTLPWLGGMYGFSGPRVRQFCPNHGWEKLCTSLAPPGGGACIFSWLWLRQTPGKVCAPFFGSWGSEDPFLPLQGLNSNTLFLCTHFETIQRSTTTNIHTKRSPKENSYKEKRRGEGRQSR